MQQFNVIGLMSGSSMDGVDLCYAEFTNDGIAWIFRHSLGETIAYSNEWKLALKNLEHESALNFCKSDAQYGHYLGVLINAFVQKNNLKVDLIASHGHTIFHQPKNQFTTQLGNGAAIHAVTGITTVNDFRSVDVALAGQGAPLVPVGERDLFEEYGMFLNLGGIANISVFDGENKVTAYDISPCNLPLNLLCEKYFSSSYDEKGKTSSGGMVDNSLLNKLEQLSYFKDAPPKSLGREFILGEYFSLIEGSSLAPEDKLCTVTNHCVSEIIKAITQAMPSARKQTILVSGGGVYNDFFMQLLQSKSPIAISVPSSFIVEFKEALIFAYLGVLRYTNSVNTLSSVTNASRNSIGGATWG